MFTFGYKLRLVKDSDRKEYELFERAVFAINTQSNNLSKWLLDGFLLDADTVQQLTIDIEGLHTFIDIYFNNKYSSPSSTMFMFSQMDILRKTSSQIIDVISEVANIDKLKDQVDNGMVPPNVEFDPHEFEETYNNAMNTATVHAKKLTNIMIGALKGITLVIESDLLKLMMGVDIMKEYKKRNKRFIKDKNLETEFVVRFKAVTKDDRRFLEKERNKK